MAAPAWPVPFGGYRAQDRTRLTGPPGTFPPLQNMRLAFCHSLGQSCAQSITGERMKTRWIFAGLLAGSALSTLVPTQAQAETRLLRDPALSDHALAFAYAGAIRSEEHTSE